MSFRTPVRTIRLAPARTFPGLMALYESNYRRFERLAPEVDLPFDAAVSNSELDRPLHLRVLERCRYTTTVHLTYWFDEEEDLRPDPDLRIRLYRDAQLAEAVHCDIHSRYAAMAGNELAGGAALNEQWPRNLLLNKWLAFCLMNGHGFAAANRPRNQADRA